MEKKKLKIPHTFVIIFALIIISAIVTFIVPGGEYVKITQGDSEILEFRYIDNQPQSWQILTAFYKGFTRQAGIIVFILVLERLSGLLTLLRQLMPELSPFSVLQKVLRGTLC